MSHNYLSIQNEYLELAWSRPPEELEAALPAKNQKSCFHFQAFGEPCELYSQEIILGGQKVVGPEGILIALYASQTPHEKVQLHPLKSFKQFPESMTYHGAFDMNVKRRLLPYISTIKNIQHSLVMRFSGYINRNPPSGNFSFTLFPLPKVALYYIFHLADKEFPPEVTCLFQSNALAFLPIAGLADVAECTSRKIIEILTELKS